MEAEIEKIRQVLVANNLKISAYTADEFSFELRSVRQEADLKLAQKSSKLYCIMMSQKVKAIAELWLQVAVGIY